MVVAKERKKENERKKDRERKKERKRERKKETNNIEKEKFKERKREKLRIEYWSLNTYRTEKRVINNNRYDCPPSSTHKTQKPRIYIYINTTIHFGGRNEINKPIG